MAYSVLVSEADFDVAKEYQRLSESHGSGAVVMFAGKVRDMNLGDQVTSLHIEHYPGMTEKSLSDICSQATARWQLDEIRVIHRVGTLAMGEQIVFVGVASIHRGEAFQACEFIMDYLKTQAPFWKKEFWKKEQTGQKERWLDAKQSDYDSATRWKLR